MNIQQGDGGNCGPKLKKFNLTLPRNFALLRDLKLDSAPKIDFCETTLELAKC